MAEQKIKDGHMLILEGAFFQSLQRDNCEYGAIGIDCKRPFGNSDVERDILEMIDEPMAGDDGDGPCYSSQQRQYAAQMYSNLIPWLQRRYREFLRATR